MYYIRVRQADVEAAKKVILENGLVTEVKSSEELMQDAAERAKLLRAQEQ